MILMCCISIQRCSGFISIFEDCRWFSSTCGIFDNKSINCWGNIMEDANSTNWRKPGLQRRGRGI